MLVAINLVAFWWCAMGLEVTHTYDGFKSLAADGLDFELRWSIDEDSVRVGMIVGTTGWVGLGFADPGGGGMLGADMVIGKYEDGVGSVEDKWSSAYATPQDDESNDWSLVFADENATHTVIEASRALDTGDAQDHTVSATFPRRLIAAFGTSDDFSYHGSNRISFRLPDADMMSLDELLAWDSSISSFDFLTGGFVIPSDETTYHSVCFQFPEGLGEVHLVAMAPNIQDSNAQYVHHFIVSGFADDKCNGGVEGSEADDGGSEDSLACGTDSQLVKFYCGDDGSLSLGFDCSSCESPESCSTTFDADSIWNNIDGGGPTCTDENNFALACSAGSVVYTRCATGSNVTSNDSSFMCLCQEENDPFPDQSIYGWGPGVEPLVLPSQAGFRIGGKSGFKSLGMNVHYNNPSNDVGAVDDSGIRLYYTSNLREHDAGVMTFGDYSGALYGDQVADSITGLSNHRFACPSECTSEYFGEDEEVTVFGTLFHMHQTGTRMALRKYNKNGDLETALATEMYDFDFQDNVDAKAMTGSSTYIFRGGDQVLVDCYYDETNGAPFTGVFGLGSDDEMCDVFVYYWPAENYGTGTSFDCSPNNCEKYCGPNFLADESGFQRSFGTPRSEPLPTYDFTKYNGCKTGSSAIPTPVVSSPTLSPSKYRLSATSPTPMPTGKASGTPQNSTNDEGEGAGVGGGSSASSKKKSSGGIHGAMIAIIVTIVLIIITVAMLGCLFSFSGSDKSARAEVSAFPSKEDILVDGEGKPTAAK